MHMADALLSPEVGAAFWGVSAATVAYCSRKVRSSADEAQIPLMGVMGAFIFAAQMINFTIPATGSSGHLGGGMLLAILLGPVGAFLTIASVLVVQALFFADGGLLALGCNIFNLGFVPAFLVYPFIFKPLAGRYPRTRRFSAAALLAAVIALQIGSFGVVLQTWMSGISALPLDSFLAVMQPIHLAIGLVEGVVTVAVINMVRAGQPGMIDIDRHQPAGSYGWRRTAGGLLLLALIIGGLFSWYASSQPDGLEWSIEQVLAAEPSEAGDSLAGGQGFWEGIQERIALLPDYGFASDAEPSLWFERLGTSLSGLVGAGITLCVIALFGLLLRKCNCRD